MLQEGTESNGRVIGGGSQFVKKSRSKKRRKDTESDEYVSNSTIDRPPRADADEDQPKQGAFFDGKSLEEKFNEENQPMDRMFAVELSLSLKPKEGKAVKIPVLVEELRGSIVNEALKLALDSRRFKKVLAAVLDVPDNDE